MNENKIFLSLILLVSVISLLFSSVVLSRVSTDTKQVGGTYFIGQRDFPDGISVDDTIVIDGDGNIEAPITSTTGTFSSNVSIAGTLSAGATTLTSLSAGATTLGDLVKVDGTASSTLQVGEISDGLASGCLILGDSDGATSTPVYITATGETITATTTKPEICQTAD